MFAAIKIYYLNAVNGTSFYFSDLTSNLKKKKKRNGS